MKVDGNWDCTINSPMGEQQATIALSTVGDRLSGTMNGPQGVQEFEGGEVDGNKLTWNINMTSPMPMTLEISAEVDGEKIAGKVKLGAFGDATFEGVRV